MSTRTSAVFTPSMLDTAKTIFNSCFVGISIYGGLPILFAAMLTAYQLFSEVQIMTTIRSLLTELFHQPWLASASNALFCIPMTAAILCGLPPVSDEVLRQAGVLLKQ